MAVKSETHGEVLDHAFKQFIEKIKLAIYKPDSSRTNDGS